MRRILLGTALLVLALADRSSAALTAQSLKVYTGANGVEVVIVQLQEPEKCLIRVTGTGSAFDSLVLPYDVEASPRRRSYQTQWRGQPYSFLQLETGGAERMVLYTPANAIDAKPLSYSEARSKAVNAGELLAQHERQMKDGAIARFARFDRPGEQARHERELAEQAAAASRACGNSIGFKVVWSSISDEVMKSFHIASFCSAPLEALERVCGSATVAQRTVREKVRQVTCRFGEQAGIALDAAGTLAWTINKDAANIVELAEGQIKQALAGAGASSAADATSPEALPWGKGVTLDEKIALEKTLVCSDGKKAFLVIAPDEQNGRRLYYGDGKQLARVPGVPRIGGEYFVDGRNYNPAANPDFRGHDMRLLSSAETDSAKKTCTVRCGTRKSELKVLDPAVASKLLLTAQFVPPLHNRAPHALARDDRGNYYYVDRGSTPDSERSFRLFVGPRGSLKLQPMTDIVSDSEGQVFATRNGKLRFVVGPNGAQSSWIKGKKTTRLMAVPVAENGSLIYNDLGVYSGQRLGTPCDDL